MLTAVSRPACGKQRSLERVWTQRPSQWTEWNGLGFGLFSPQKLLGSVWPSPLKVNKRTRILGPRRGEGGGGCLCVLPSPTRGAVAWPLMLRQPFSRTPPVSQRRAQVWKEKSQAVSVSTRCLPREPGERAAGPPEPTVPAFPGFSRKPRRTYL